MKKPNKSEVINMEAIQFKLIFLIMGTLDLTNVFFSEYNKPFHESQNQCHVRPQTIENLNKFDIYK